MDVFHSKQKFKKEQRQREPRQRIGIADLESAAGEYQSRILSVQEMEMKDLD